MNKHICKDPIRLYRGANLRSLVEEAGGVCSHPFCDSQDLHAHHIIEHCKGGLTILENGLMLCPRCHQIVHKGCMPYRLLFDIKSHVNKQREMFYDEMKDISAEGLIFELNDLVSMVDKSNDVLMGINDVIIKANYLPSWNSRYLVFSEALIAKASILSDGIREVRKDFDFSKRSLAYRRTRVVLLGAWAFYFSNFIKSSPHILRALHFRATAYNARRNHKAAIREYKRAVDFINIQKNMQTIPYHLHSSAGRIFREVGVTRLRAGNSRVGEKEVIKGLNFALDRGEQHDVWDAQIRFSEANIYLGNFHVAENVIGELYGQWDVLGNDILRALIMKMDAKLKIATGSILSGVELLEEGAKWSAERGQFHEEYVFTELLNKHGIN